MFLCRMNPVVYYISLLLVSVSAVNYSRIDESSPVGFASDLNYSGIDESSPVGIASDSANHTLDQGLDRPIGFLTKCPGSWKPAHIRPKSLRKLFISVMGPGHVMKAKWTPYHYYNIQKLAKHPEIDFSKKTFLYVTGYLDSTTIPLGRVLGEVYRKMGYNSLILDTLEFTATFYPLAARMIRAVGKHVAEMLAKLTTLGLDPKKLELVGLSLGGQTMSFIAKNYRQITGQNISTLVGLDPAGPCFRHLGPEDRLDKSNADFVLSVVTNSEGFGMGVPSGHMTFYVNGGEYQPGDLDFLPCSIECSHIRGFFIWLSALLHPQSFIGIQCDSIQQAKDFDCYDRQPRVTNTLDRFTDRTKPGIYFLRTSGRFPYFLGKKGLKKGLKVTSGPFIVPNVGDLYDKT